MFLPGTAVPGSFSVSFAGMTPLSLFKRHKLWYTQVIY